MSIDLDRITHPLRLAQGSHQPGSGKGCAMNVISYINGDTKITDYPECSARPLASLVQMVNDNLAGPDGFLSPENSVLVLDLGWQTVGTAGVSDAVYALWIADMLDSPEWGVVRFADEAGAVAIREIADLHRRAAAGEVPFAWSAAGSAAWSAARSAARSAAWSAAKSAAWSAAESAAKSAAESAAWSAAESAAWSAAESAAWSAAKSAAWSAAKSAAGSAAGSAAWSAAKSAAKSAALIEFTRKSIARWRELADLDPETEIDAADVDSALARIYG
ncbi:hypothetical protein SEA_MODRAGONS_58 [Mycobacterium phage Modragons]|uniref:Uncharacterized protein n=1 Tax=Mycobacterium phage Ochi17 TaxID=2502425 RepID=A0A411BTH3_9CAUD|nr:hypothetical protein KNU45_gp057 [Mycobacterium phage Ochi17]QAY04911.1 hypothetical protein SEA_OCHI17_57 [Mycobacterium phage Ochi17]QFP96442.1 hypothetical protein SEA_MODRAGONS_58 [Mycobacterium phage Modragons]QOP67142.1 hypothetical protein SEA_SEABASTIAN_59 [Mycobacterium phage Seabastian]QOP67253.1 hypothetical protein SEA_OFULTRON_59 [Mycobacterium phage OfUltron]